MFVWKYRIHTARVIVSAVHVLLSDTGILRTDSSPIPHFEWVWLHIQHIDVRTTLLQQRA